MTDGNQNWIDGLLDFAIGVVDTLPESIARRILFRAVRNWLVGQKDKSSNNQKTANALLTAFGVTVVFFGFFFLLFIAIPWLLLTLGTSLEQYALYLLTPRDLNFFEVVISMIVGFVLGVASAVVIFLGDLLSIPARLIF
ncbi:hypothetical protein [Aliisedimentitalea sp. MJ-SS2]|uniref:hypothetical protein n=1 Tax=Aliisedimentitalea sp. MJ-SS2 TaxID=3049795 RepID=UPI0029319403|nr:hypothetical protein [Alisedimentitalea sp. MJ-SS2]